MGMGSDVCDVPIATRARGNHPGHDNWVFKEMKLRAHSEALKQETPQKYRPTVYKLPPMKNLVKPYPSKVASRVIKTHYQTQEILKESSQRAGRECHFSQDAIQRARGTLNTWNDA